MYLLRDTVPAEPVQLWARPPKPRRSLAEAQALHAETEKEIVAMVRQRRELDREIERKRGHLFALSDDIAWYGPNADGPEAA